MSNLILTEKEAIDLIDYGKGGEIVHHDIFDKVRWGVTYNVVFLHPNGKHYQFYYVETDNGLSLPNFTQCIEVMQKEIKTLVWVPFLVKNDIMSG